MLAITRTLIFGMMLLSAACVTVNVYFPEAAAENAADRIIREVYGQEAPKAAEPAPGTDEQSWLEDAEADTVSLLVSSVLGFVVSSAHAADPDINISTPAIAQLQDRMSQRHTLFEPFYESGAIGMDNRGLLTMRASQTIPIRERNKVKQLIVAENSDRNALYLEIAKANGRKDWETKIREIFARRWVGNAPYGWWFQDQSGNWQQK